MLGNDDIQFRDNGIICLIGAGCSFEAGVPVSNQMINDLEEILSTNEWNKYLKIYNFVKSSILYSDGIKGKFSNSLNIERLMNVLTELEKKENSILYPFIGSWNPRLVALAGHDFSIISDLKMKIFNKLRDWISLDDYRNADYYNSFFRFQENFSFPLRIFSLNYDLCFEENTPPDKKLERGFDTDKIWDWRRFERNEIDEVEIYLYKLHGSLDWKRDINQGNIVKCVDSIPKNPDLIFGTDYKMQYIDPYLFFTYEFRNYSLESLVIVVIGYSFGDEHINGILKQALENNSERKLIVVSPSADSTNIANIMQYNNLNQIIAVQNTAKKFLKNKLTITYLRKLLS